MFKFLYIGKKFYLFVVGLIGLMILGFVFPFVLAIAQILLIIFLGFCIYDVYYLFHIRVPLFLKRRMPAIWNLAYTNSVNLDIHWHTEQYYEYSIYEELPFEWINQRPSVQYNTNKKIETIQYSIVPTKRGEFTFGNSLCFISSKWGLFERKLIFKTEAGVKVYPAIAQFKDPLFSEIGRQQTQGGVHHRRRLGHGYEFEQIKTYIEGDDVRSINWKATGRMNSIMVNQYEDDYAQTVYHLLDKSRIMNFETNSMSLLDYAINAILIHAKTVLDHKDKVGLISFSNVMETVLPASKDRNQLSLLLGQLYKEKGSALDANYEALFHLVRNKIQQRSLLFLYTNVESISALERITPYLQGIQKKHRLVVVFFRNIQVDDRLDYQTREFSKGDVYENAVLENYNLEKQSIVNRLALMNIEAVLVRPGDLAISAINKYLELKGKAIF